MNGIDRSHEFDKRRLVSQLRVMVGPDCIREDEPMRDHTSYRIGGPADIFVMPDTVHGLLAVLRHCRSNQVPHLIIGRGSNLLVGDKGIRGVVIQIGDNMGWVRENGESLSAGAGISLKSLAGAALEYGLTGIEFAAGIPGTLGGAVAMNAGAYEGEMSQVVDEVEVINDNTELLTLTRSELNFGYRRSIIQENGYIVVSARLQLAKGDRDTIKARMDELWERRLSKQPLEYPSCGSVFRRPQGYFAGKLIQDAGLRGAKVGQAQVSEKHCGFIVNLGGATAKDVLGLIRLVQQTVKQKFGVEMETEVKLVGEF